MKNKILYILSPLHSITIVISVVLDQFTKWLTIQYIPLGTKIELMPFVNLSHIKNRGAAFGVFHDMPNLFRALFFGAITIVCFYLLFSWLVNADRKDRLQRFSLSLLIGGAIGNVIDRVVFGEVTDFIDCYYGPWHFPTFNVADSAITIGVTLLFIRIIPWSNLRFKRRAKVA